MHTSTNPPQSSQKQPTHAETGVSQEITFLWPDPENRTWSILWEANPIPHQPTGLTLGAIRLFVYVCWDR